ncbi:MAG: ABC transporter permease [Dictyoglomi bacterium]|jgi:peptide/nickel transport system permease protein|nr:ABC transporter permease [Dictyoglomota bacterium]HHV80102.1 ABC transporter permease [bacterium]HOK29601.1 ABC transporter permease [bacterium]HOL55396.1 ABC transporter permease [bacterium]HRU32842.1 ABC transporter permease [bacterium]
MTQYIIKRIGWIIFNLLVLSLIAFILIKNVPGSFLELQILIGQAGTMGTGLTISEVEKVRGVETEMMKRWGEDVPLWQQYLTFIKGLVTLDMGPSFRWPTQTIEEIIANTFPVSFTIAILAVTIAIIIGIPLGVLAALKQNSWIDYLVSALVMVVSAIPNYVMAVFVIFLFSFWIPILPTYGWGQPKNYILPVLAMSFGPIGSIAGYMRTSLLDALKQDYIRTAWAKGGTERHVIFGHAMKNSLIPLVTILGPMISHLILGTVFVEGMFGVPGMGQYFSQAAGSRDYPLMMAQTVIFGLILMIMNLIVDIIYFFLDPRIRVSRR